MADVRLRVVPEVQRARTEIDRLTTQLRTASRAFNANAAARQQRTLANSVRNTARAQATLTRRVNATRNSLRQVSTQSRTTTNALRNTGREGVRAANQTTNRFRAAETQIRRTAQPQTCLLYTSPSPRDS